MRGWRGAVGTEIAQAQDDLGDSIADTVVGRGLEHRDEQLAAPSAAVRASSAASLDLGEQTGLAIADASGGNNNVSFVS